MQKRLKAHAIVGRFRHRVISAVLEGILGVVYEPKAHRCRMETPLQ